MEGSAEVVAAVDKSPYELIADEVQEAVRGISSAERRQEILTEILRQYFPWTPGADDSEYKNAREKVQNICYERLGVRDEGDRIRITPTAEMRMGEIVRTSLERHLTPPRTRRAFSAPRAPRDFPLSRKDRAAGERDD